MSDASDKKKRAVALKYDAKKDAAPRVIAKGDGDLADRIVELAMQHGIQVKEDRALLELLATVELDREIPPVLYHAVAEVLSYVYRVTNMKCGETIDKGDKG